MKKRTIYITNYDRKRLEELITSYRPKKLSKEEQNLFDLLEGRLRRSEIVDWREIKPTIVTMCSSVRLKSLTDNETFNCSLVFPEDANPNRNKISILSYLGISLLGRHVNDVLKLKSSQGRKHFVINTILYQPESNGVCSL
ncbi:MAG: GreA/GreB family elongation factor [Phycisphaerae bacterium]|nr:GreA/GreB family elongation factor [Phycisphaerae bacterium]